MTPDNELDPGQMLADVLDGVAALAEREDALDAELAGATVLATVSTFGEDVVPLLVKELIPQVESRPNRGALALLLSIGSVASGTQDQIASAAAAAAERVAAAGVPKPRWAAELSEPLRAGDRVRLKDRAGTLSVLVASFERAGRRHAFLVTVDHQDCGAASDIFFVDADDLPEMLDELRADGMVAGTQAVDPAEFRWYVEDALGARAVHDGEDPDTILVEGLDPDLSEEDDEDEAGPPYQILAALVRTRLTALPPARKPAGAREHHEAGPADGFLSLLQRPARAKLPTKRKKSDGPAPIYQIKIGLQGAKPPIWRRLLVPADVSLASLHHAIQLSFGWEDSHLHVFDTPYGDFGIANRELGHRAEKPVTLEQVAPQAKDKIRYVYDFGDDWVHDILVEKVLDRDPTLTYPRCVGGRRAAPPDDCGGIWGYEELVEILGDPSHPDHEERLEWLGWDDAAHFDPAAFDPDEVNQAFTKAR
ncbi:plasmid pRiA4b ORF-3 family protein [Phytohabitans sp. ZYX-F-186]|uniref:Plasmid pRiA4b ORF-3 family protein n=1 Tax=Phytohabitans maris TaxID=3071409 RepID=A0ABU0Z8V6_9ACTN|nr:plasmid pRiA4b ORF-3 family protein [Phytohabitans sp. ZYX-F-186]MDQ7903477.1 plasmid pRiA4b ORF-3 family protein [Phytohabitans sp. ZYX-F-186]